MHVVNGNMESKWKDRIKVQLINMPSLYCRFDSLIINSHFLLDLLHVLARREWMMNNKDTLAHYCTSSKRPHAAQLLSLPLSDCLVELAFVGVFRSADFAKCLDILLSFPILDGRSCRLSRC